MLRTARHRNDLHLFVTRRTVSIIAARLPSADFHEAPCPAPIACSGLRQVYPADSIRFSRQSFIDSCFISLLCATSVFVLPRPSRGGHCVRFAISSPMALCPAAGFPARAVSLCRLCRCSPMVAAFSETFQRWPPVAWSGKHLKFPLGLRKSARRFHCLLVPAVLVRNRLSVHNFMGQKSSTLFSSPRENTMLSLQRVFQFARITRPSYFSIVATASR